MRYSCFSQFGSISFNCKGLTDGNLLFFLKWHSFAFQLTLAVIAFDRYQSINNCMQYSAGMTEVSYVTKGMLFIWGQSLVYTLVPIFMSGSKEGLSEIEGPYFCISTSSTNWLYAIMMHGICFCEAVVIMVYSYGRVLWIARQHQRQIADISHVSSCSSTQPSIDPDGALALAMVYPVQRLILGPHVLQSHSFQLRQMIKMQMKRDDSRPSHSSTLSKASRGRKASVKLLGLIAVFLICWLPTELNTFSWVLGEQKQHNVKLTTVALAMSLLCSVLNPYLYAVCSTRYRVLMKRLLEGKRQEEMKRYRRVMRGRQQKALAQLAALYNTSRPNSNSHPHRKICTWLLWHLKKFQGMS